MPISAQMKQQLETWKDAPGYEGLYEISSMGRVRSISRVIQTRRGARKPYLGRLMITTSEPGRPQTIILTKAGNRRCEKVGQLVLQAFVGARGKNDVVAYRDRDPSNNQLSNLMWINDVKG